MRKEEKQQIIDDLTSKISGEGHFYLADTSELTVAEINDLRRLCFAKGVQLQVAKNTLIQKALEASENKYEGLDAVLKGPTSLMFTEISNTPAKVIKEFRKKHEKPVLKAACIDLDVYIGEEYLEYLANIKSKEEVIGDIITLLQSPAKNVVSALQSSGGKLAGIVKTLSERSE